MGDVKGFAAGLGGDTIPALAAASAAARPGRVAVTVDGEPVTHAELEDAAARIAGWLARRVRPGGRVLLAAEASVGFVRCYLGALKAGAAEAAVAGVPHERWGEQVTAWVVLRDGHGFDEAALIAYARARLAGYKCPKQVFQRTSLPRNHVGKIVRGALR